jgi:hypothetical protein
MADWEFLIQREGDRGWRSIETGNLQLKEGKYRIVASSNLIATQMQLRITHQTLGLAVPQRRSRSCGQTSNASGLVVIIPFTHLQSGIWQFVCSGIDPHQTAWHRILKLRVLQRTPAPAVATAPVSLNVVPRSPSLVQTEEIAQPTAPIIPLSKEEPETWADGLDRLLEQLERESLQTPPHTNQGGVSPQAIQINPLVDPPSQLISLTRRAFSGIIPGTRLTIAGECNLQFLNANPIRANAVKKLSICLRNPQTAEIVGSIECTLPQNLDAFVFRGQLDLPAAPKVGLLLGEVSLYDKHHIQLGSGGFTITLNLSPFNESELSLLQLFDDTTDEPAAMARITQELKAEALNIGSHGSSGRTRSTTSSVTPLSSPQSSPVPLTDNPAFAFTHPDISPVEPLERSAPQQYPPLQPKSPPPQPLPTSDLTDELEIDVSYVPLNLSPEARNYPNLEIVIDD